MRSNVNPIVVAVVIVLVIGAAIGFMVYRTGAHKIGSGKSPKGMGYTLQSILNDPKAIAKVRERVEQERANGLRR